MTTENLSGATAPLVIENELIEVDFARNFQESIISSFVLDFEKEELRNKILSADEKQLLVVKSTINSPKKITSVEFYNEEFLMNNL